MKTETGKKKTAGRWLTAAGFAGIFAAAVLLAPSLYAESGQTVTVQQPGSNSTHDPFGSFKDEMAAWNPWEEMARMQHAMEQMMQRSFFSPSPAGMNRKSYYLQAPSLEVENNENEYVLKFDLPGMEKDKLDVTITEDHLTVSGERRQISTEENADGIVQWSERSYGSFSRTIPLPENARTEDMTAKYENGVLRVTIPKEHPEKAEPEKVKKIKID